MSSTVLAMGLFMSPTGESVAWAQEPTEEEAAAEGAAEEAAEESEEAGEAAAEEAGDEAAEAEAEAAEKAKMEAEKAKMEAEKAKKAAEKAKMEAEKAKMEAKKEAAAAEAAAAEATAEAAPVEGPAEEGEVEELMVTGSRIRRKDLSTPAPVAVIDTQTINNSGLITIGQILQNLPAQSNAINIQFNNGGDGSTRVNLRGLGAPRTLVLLNGRRVVPGGTGANASVDLNMVPIEIIERVEVLKDGASAVYGSDAIGGVVNIITKKDFSGVEAGTYFGAGQHGAEQFQASITAGETTDRSAFLMSFQYFRQEPMFAGARDFSKSDLAFDWPSGDESTLGSSAPPEGLIIAGGGGGNDAWNEHTANNDFVYFNDPEDGWRTAQLTGNSDVGEGDFYNYQPENYLVTPAERYSIFGQGHYDLTDKVKLYAEALYSNRRSDQ
ncbi:MAG: TonB-dependent receptor plug domain-containing protein, partial [Deltaproteobacteria bacterium]